jgi:hypothetical protein
VPLFSVPGRESARIFIETNLPLLQMQQLFKPFSDYFMLFSRNGKFRTGYTVLRNQLGSTMATLDAITGGRLAQIEPKLDSLPRPVIATPSRNVPPAPNIAHTLHNRHVRQITTQSGLSRPARGC